MERTICAGDAGPRLAPEIGLGVNANQADHHRPALDKGTLPRLLDSSDASNRAGTVDAPAWLGFRDEDPTPPRFLSRLGSVSRPELPQDVPHVRLYRGDLDY